jgi:hypothetical protein
MRVAQVVKPAAQCVDFVYEDDAALRRLARCLEEFSYPLWTHSHINLLELGCDHLDEIAACLIGQSPSQHSLPSAWRTVE